MEQYNSFDRTNHLLPPFDKVKFDSLCGWDFGWSLLQPINIAVDQGNSEIELSRRLSPGQKALYFIWYLDSQVTNGGFIQFYWNGYRKYINPIVEGLRLIGDIEMLDLLQKADLEFMVHVEVFKAQRSINDVEPLYENLVKFEEYDSLYYSIHDNTISFIEKYARKNPKEFVDLR